MPIPRVIFHYSSVGIAALALFLLMGCSYFPESSFTLANDSRLPKWFKLAPGQSRADVTVTMDYYAGTTAEFTLRNSYGFVLSEVKGNTKGTEPLQRATKSLGYAPGYPAYEVVTVGNVTDIIEHRKMEPIFYVTDDPAVWAEFAGHG